MESERPEENRPRAEPDERSDTSDEAILAWLSDEETGSPAPPAGPLFEAELAGVSPAPLGRRPAPRRRGRRLALPISLFLLTCLSTFFAGACLWLPTHYLALYVARPIDSYDFPLRRVLWSHWDDGLIYMGCVLAILMTHEMGHFLATVRYRIPASLPYFLPLPISPIGTIGAVIGMDGKRANRKETFDIGIAGPLAGLVVAVPILWIGISRLDFAAPAYGAFKLDPPLAARLLLQAIQPDYPPGSPIWQSQLNPYFMAGWIGLFITGLNMMPVSQLDGGHVIYTLFGKRSYWIARAFILIAVGAMILGLVHGGLWLMVVMVMLIGADHPPTRDDNVPLGWVRTVLGYASLAIPVLCFAPKLIIVS